MNTLLLRCAALGVAALALTSARADEPLTAAVLDFQAASGMPESTGKDVGALLAAKLSASPRLVLVERAELDKMLGETELGAGGAEKSPAQIGQLVGAQVLITGRVFTAGSSNYVVVKVMGVETGRVFGDVTTFADPSRIPGAIDQLAGKIDAILGQHAGDIVAQPSSLDAAFAKLKESLGGRKRPTVAVAIPERQVGARSVDPAAQTQMLHRLQELGFPVLDPSSDARRADILISGEAFSELGLRKGSLVACNARVEVKVIRRADDALLFTDAQRSVAFDLGETSTGKLALEKATDQILLRIAPALKLN